MCNTLEELHEYIDPGQLTEDLGGLIPYDHDRWMEQRMVSDACLAAQVLLSHHIAKIP